MSRRVTLVFISAMLLLALGLVSLALWRHHTAEPSLAELHEQHPWARRGDGYEVENRWLAITDVQFSKEGTVTIAGAVADATDRPEGPAAISGFSPGGRIWTPEILQLGSNESFELQYRFFEYSNAEPEPVEGYYCVVVERGDTVNHVFVNFLTGDWKAD